MGISQFSPYIPPTLENTEYARYALEKQFDEIDDISWTEILFMAKEKGWNDERFMAAFRYVLWNKSSWVPAGEKMPRVSISDFNRYKEPLLYPYSWYQERVSENRTKAQEIGCYRLPDGGKGFGWIAEVGNRLPHYEPPIIAAKPVPELPPINKGTLAAIDQTSEILGLKATIKDLKIELEEWRGRATRAEAALEFVPRFEDVEILTEAV